MVRVIVTYVNGDQEVFKGIDEDSIKVEGNILQFEEFASWNGKHRINLDHVRSWTTKI